MRVFFCSIAILLLSAGTVSAQKNSIKARFVYLPQSSGHIAGIGYERIITDFFSGQFTINSRGYNWEPGHQRQFVSYIPEVKLYFGGTENYSRSFFISAFVEFANDKYPTHERVHNTEHPELFYLGSKIKEINPGITVGKNFHLSNVVHFEIFGGFKSRYFEETKEYLNIRQFDRKHFREYEKISGQALAFRAGVNLNFRF